MTLARLWALAGFGLTLGMACMALAWRDCVLLATSMVLAYRLSLLHMEHGAPWRVLSAAFNALSIGVVAGAAGVVLIAGVGAAWLQWWQPQPDHPIAVVVTLFASAALCCMGKHSSEGALAEAWPWLWMAGGALLAIEAQRRDMWLPPCLLALVVGAVLVRVGWRLATLSAPAMLRAGSAPQ